MMPPVRWKLSTVITVWLLQVYAKAQYRQDEISVDGWRPILGTRKPNFYGTFSPTPKDYYKYEAFSTGSPTAAAPTASPTMKPYFRGGGKPFLITGRKIPHQKHYHPDPYFALPTHNRHIPISSVVHTRPSQIGHIKQLVSTGKPYIQLNSEIGHIKPKATNQPFVVPTTNKPFMVSTTKPFMVSTTSKRNVQTSTPGYRDDIFTASATSGVYNSQKPGGSNIRTRETVDLGLPGQNHYSINQPHAHIEFNRFPTSESVFQQYNNPSVAPHVFKHPQSNEINFQIQQQNDEFTRNVYKNRVKPEVILQVPPPFQYQQNDQQVQVQVTKEKLHEFHNNIPQNYHGQYIEYDFSRRKPTENPKPAYEVTEGAWQEPPAPPRRRRPVNRRPDTNEVVPPPPKRRPFEEQAPVFLPTPYKPEKQAVEPTSPTQEEVSTVFTKLSQLQREKVTPDPHVFSVKEVSTHYPIFGKPVFAEVPKELSNEITTPVEEEVPTTREPQRIRPHRRRRPESKRTTTTTTVVPEPEENSAETERPMRIRRPNRFRTTTPSTSEESTVKLTRGRNRYRIRTPPEESQEAASEKSEEIEPSRPENEVPQETIKPFIIITTTEKLPTTNLVVPEEENEVTSLPIEDTTTTMAPTTVTSPHRIRTRPLKFDNSNRPRFSVKDYRQKLNLHSSTTTAQPHRSTDTVRIRSRLRRPVMTTPATEEETEAPRPKFVPKEARHGVTTEAAIITERNVKSVNTRLRPFGKFKTTTTTTTTAAPKVSIKSNLFNRKRPPMLTLRNKIFNKYYKNVTEVTTEKPKEEEEEDEEEDSTVEYEDEEVETTTEAKSTEREEEFETTTVADISKVDPFFYSQRVSDLTSSAKNDYNTPGLFKSVSPTSRRIPNSFTIATDDPILPLEAFFSNIKEKNREQDF